MSLFDAATIQRFFNQGENELSVERPFLSDRLSLAIVAPNNIFTLPDYVISIRRITYQGMKLDPLPHRNFREVFQNATQKSRPFWYVYNNVGQNQVQFFPAPNISIAAAVGNLYTGSVVASSVIVEYYRATDNQNFVIPAYARRQLLKTYAASKIYGIEGQGQSLKLAAYFTKKWQVMKQEFITHLNDLYGRPRKLIVNEIVSSNYFPGAPVLPIGQFGISVDEGY